MIDPDLLAAASWTTEPAAVRHTDRGLEVTAVEGSDAWRHTSYGWSRTAPRTGRWPRCPTGSADGTVRASRTGDAVTVRARVDDDPWRLVRVAHVDPDVELRAGPYCCAPTRAGLTVVFDSWVRTAPDAALH